MAPENQQTNSKKSRGKKRDNPRPFIKYEKVTQPVIDDDTKQVVINPRTGKPVMAVVGYKPLLRKGGLTEEILDTGNLKTLEDFWEEHEDDLNETEKAYMEARLNTAREVKRLGDASKADLAEGKTAPRPEPDEKDGFVGFSDLKYPGKQTSGNGCWSCAYSLLLKSRGIDLSQEKIRAWRPDRSKDTTMNSKDKGVQRKHNATSFRMNTDGVNGLMENADLLGQVLPNTSLSQVSMKPLVRDELFVDGKPVDNKQYDKILKHYKAEMKAKLTDQIRQAIEVDKSPVALSIDGHFVTITGISKDGNTIRYEDSLPAGGKITNTMKMDEMVHRATEDHKSWGGHTVSPSGLSITWIKDIDVPEYEKRAEEKPLIHAEDPGLVKLDESGKITVDVPATHESATSLGDMATGQIEGKGVSNPVVMKQEDLTKLMGGKPFFSIGIGGGYTMGYADNYYPGRVFYKNDPELLYEKLQGEQVESQFSDLEESIGGIIRNAEKNGKTGAWTEQLKEYNKAVRTIRDYARDPEDEKNKKALPEAVKKLKELPDFLASKEGEKTVYQHMTENMLQVYRASSIKNLLKLDETLSLKTDFEKLMGVGKEIHPNDVDYREDQQLDWISAANHKDRDEVTRKSLNHILAGILARRELRMEKQAGGDAHPAIRAGEFAKRRAQIMESEAFRKLTEGDRIFELAMYKDTERLHAEYAKEAQRVLAEEPKAEQEPKAGGGQAAPKTGQPKANEKQSDLEADGWEILPDAASFQDYSKKDFEKYAFTSLNPDAVKKNAKQIGELYKMIDGNNTWGGSKNNNYKNTLSKLKQLKELSESYAEHGMILSDQEVKRYQLLVKEVDKLAAKYLTEKTDINSAYASKRVDGMKRLRGALEANVMPLPDAMENMRQDMIKEVFGDVNKTYNETNPWLCENNAFYGEKYADPSTRTGGSNNFSLQRSTGISLSIFALAATGKYTLDELMDNNKLREEKAAMYDTVATHIKNAAPGNEHTKWLAEQIYKGQIATEKMLEDTAKTVDFSDPNIRQDRTFCQLLHLTAHQQDAWQEMSHCKDEILEIAKKDHPEMTKWEDYKKWWTNRKTPLTYINDAMKKQQTEAVKMMTQKTGLDKPAGQLALQGGYIDRTIKRLADAQKSDKKDLPLRDWFSLDSKMEDYVITSPLGQEALKGNFKYLDDDPQFSQLVTKGLVDGTLRKNIDMSLDRSKGKVVVTGAPTKEEVEKYAETQKFLKKTDAALKRLEEKKYTSEEAFLKDSAYAIFGQIHRMTGNSAPVDTKTGKQLTMEEYVAKAVKSKQFKEFLRSKTNPDKYMSPKSVAQMAKDQNIMKKTIDEKQKELGKKNPTVNGQNKAPTAPEEVNPRR